MNPTNTTIPASYTFNNITVNLNDTQKALLDSDLQTINTLSAKIISLQNQRATWETTIYDAQNALAHCKDSLNAWLNDPATIAGLVVSPFIFGPIRQSKENAAQQCIDNNNATWSNARAQQAAIDGQIAQTNTDITNAKNNFNNDLTAIQDAIKLQIQSQVANSAAATQNASNIAGINASNPQLLIQQAQSAEAIAKAKQDKQTKLVEFGIVAGVIIIIGIFVIKKLL